MSAKWAKLQEAKVLNYADMPLFDFITSVTPSYERPEHLSAVVPYMEAAMTSPQRFTFSAPPRHGKSQLVFHFIARYIAKYPHRVVAYTSYTASLAERRSEEIRWLCQRAGVEFDKSSTSKRTWRTAAGGSFLARGPGGPLTGEGVHLLVLDDPYAGRAAAESEVVRENLWDWWTSVAFLRLEPGASVVVTHTRWAVGDITDRLTLEKKWPHLNFPAINEETGESLWPSRYTVEDLKVIRAMSEYDWASLYQGHPVPRGGAVFGATAVYTPDELAKVKFKRLSIGIDCAYSTKTHSDFSVAIVLGEDDQGRAWVLDMRRKQCEAMAFAEILRQLRMAYGSPPITWYIGSIEKPVVELFRSKGVPIKALIARDDKFVRAQAVAAAWNAGQVLLPSEHKPWSDAFMSEVLQFTGIGDAHDDIVDALAAAYAPLAGKKATVPHMAQNRLLAF